MSNIKFGIAFKLGGLRDVPRSSCNFVGLGSTTMITFIGNKFCVEKGFTRNSAKISKFGTFFTVLHFGLFGLNTQGGSLLE
jgi:hypothetical protein